MKDNSYTHKRKKKEGRLRKETKYYKVHCPHSRDSGQTAATAKVNHLARVKMHITVSHS